MNPPTPDHQSQPSDHARPEMSERIRAHIKTHQESSEILIGWVQLAVVGLFGSLYLVSPKTSINADFQPVPWALTLYLVFTLVRLLLAYRKKLPQWMLVISILLDMFLLMALIWSFHIQYQQPPSFYLKSPTLLYVFVFIALRALRFDVKYVVLAGAVAATGWLFNVAYAIYVDMKVHNSMPMLTRDYVEYMTSNSILVGAELDKIISILIVTSIIALAISRARSTMIDAAVGESTTEELSRFVPDAVAENIIHAENEVTTGQTVRGDATILFIDIEKFTTIAEDLQPEALVTTLNEYFARVSTPIRRHHGVITQFQGDAILASFNMPEQNPKHAANAISAAIEIQKILKEQTFSSGLNLRARIGLNSGLVVGGLVGTEDHVSYTVHGDTVNLAARLEQKNKELGTRILMSRDTANAAGDVFSREAGVKSLGSVEIRGHSNTLEVLTIA